MGGNGKVDDDVGELRNTIARLTKSGHADLCGLLQEKLDEMVRKQRLDKPISQTLRVMENKIADKRATIEGHVERIAGAEAEIERAEQKKQREMAGKAARDAELSNLLRELEDAAKGPPTMGGVRYAGVPEDLQSLPEGISTEPGVAAAMEAIQKAADEARQAIKAAQDRTAHKDTEMPGADATSIPAGDEGDTLFEETEVYAVVEELRKNDDLAVYCSGDGAPDQGRVRRLMEAMARGTRRKLG
jgi:hypothetical protein